MSRSGYSDDCENVQLWRGAVKRALEGRRGQAALREILAALDAMPVKELVANEFEADGHFCTLGVLAHARGIPLKPDKFGDYREIAGAKLGLADAMVAEIMFENDDDFGYANYMNSVTGKTETPAERWSRMRAWVEMQIKDAND